MAGFFFPGVTTLVNALIGAPIMPFGE